MTYFHKWDGEHEVKTLTGLYCLRCGRDAAECVHLHLFRTDGTLMNVTADPNHAARISARYDIGKRFNPDHDTTSYSDETTTKC